MGVYLKCGGDGSFSWHKDNVKVYVLHSRAGLAQQVWIESNGDAVLADCGDGCLRDILKHDLNLAGLRAILITHGHFDHMGGLHTLLGFLRMIGRGEDLFLISPENCAEVTAMIDSFVSVYGNSMPFNIVMKSLPDQGSVEVGGFKITAREMVHSGSVWGGEILDRIPALGYRINAGGKDIAVSGDTGLCESVTELVRGADLAIIEATIENSAIAKKETLERVHLSEDIAHKLGQTAGEYALIHKGKRQGKDN